MKTKADAVREIARIRIEQAKLQQTLDEAERLILKAMIGNYKDNDVVV